MKQLLKSFGGRSRTEMAVFFPGPLMPRGVSLGRYMETSGGALSSAYLNSDSEEEARVTGKVTVTS